jgi:hypothetical protein
MNNPTGPITMPHSVSPPPQTVENGDLPDAPSPAGGEGESIATDKDMMDGSKAVANKDESKKNIEIKLEELFPDDEDDEFSSSAPTSSNVPAKEHSSPPMEPL